jgi:hypothetical protein
VTSRETHACSASCSDPGICQIDTAPQSIEATFTGRHETFQYTKVLHSRDIICYGSLIFTCYVVYARFVQRQNLWHCANLEQVAKQLQCVKTIPQGQTSHEGSHTHSKEKRPFHFCKARCVTKRYSVSKRMLTRYSCENCGYFCTLPLGKVPPPQIATDADGCCSTC